MGRVTDPTAPRSWSAGARAAALGFGVALVIVLASAACGEEDGGGSASVTGRVMSVRGQTACVSDDRGATETCVDVGTSGALRGTEVGACASATRPQGDRPGRVELVDDAECADADLGG